MQRQILVIDDSKPIHTLIKALLVDDPVDIHSATDAAYGLVLAASVHPDLILLDVDMPGTNGFDACRQLKANPETANIPVIFLTALSSVEEKVRGLELGAVDYITKPFNAAELHVRVRGSLRTSHLIHLLEAKAMIDSLTGLGNRAMFDQRLAAEIALRIRFKSPLTCILIDVDNFKTINDNYGHPFGDHVLQKIAGVISEIGRTEDVACRYGGEEFVIITPHTNATDAAMLAERMRAAIAAIQFVQQGNSFTITSSFGVAEAGDTYDRTMLKRADDAMYCSKQNGRNRVSVAPQISQTAAA
jgi:diguanylate cyclase (GGDEF)-like protein